MKSTALCLLAVIVLSQPVIDRTTSDGRSVRWDWSGCTWREIGSMEIVLTRTDDETHRLWQRCRDEHRKTWPTILPEKKP